MQDNISGIHISYFVMAWTVNPVINLGASPKHQVLIIEI